MNACVIYNPAAGRRRARKSLQVLREILARHAVEAQWMETASPGHARTLAAQCRKDRADLIIAAGGDGTVSEIAGTLVDPAGSGPELLVWPMGSGNDFVANTGSARHAKEWEKALLQGTVRIFDAGILDIQEPSPFRCYFFNNAGFGLEANVISESVKIRTLRGLPLYLVSALRSLRRALLYDVKFRMDGTEAWESVSLTMLSVANGPRSGGGFRLLPSAAADDGILDIGLVRMPHRRTLLRLLGLMLLRKHLQSQWIDYRRGAGFELKIPGGMPVHADGDLVSDCVYKIRISIEPGVLRVRVPTRIGCPSDLHRTPASTIFGS